MILQKYILRQLAVTFASLFVVCMAVCLIGMSFQLFRKFEAMDVDLLTRMMPLAAGYVAPLVLLFAASPSATLVYGRLAAENEIDAMRMSGIHAGRILAPAVLFGLVLTLAAYGILEYATPAATEQRRRTLRDSALILLRLPPSGKQVGIRVGLYELSYLDYTDGRMERIDLMRRGADGLLLEEYQAVSGRAVIEEDKPPKIYLSKASFTNYRTAEQTISFTFENDFPVTLDMEGISGGKKRAEDMTQEELWDAYGETGNPRKRAELLTVYHTRYAQSLAPLLLILVSSPIGVYVKRASRLAGLGASLPPFILYMVAFFVCKGAGEKAGMDPLLAAWLPDGILLLMGAGTLGVMLRR